MTPKNNHKTESLPGTVPDKLEPFNVEAEEAVLGSLLIDPEKIELVSFLQSDDFWTVRYSWIFEAIRDLNKNGTPSDLVTLSDKLEKRKQLEKIGGSAMLSTLINRTPTSTHLVHYAQIVANSAFRRRCIEKAGEIARCAYDEEIPDSDIQAQLTEFQNLRYPIVSNGKVSSWADIESIIGPIIWAWPAWLPAGLLTMIVSESGVGKSALALRIAACYLQSDSWPDGSSFTSEPGKILWCEAEAAQAINMNRAKDWNLPIDSILSPLADPLADIELDNPEHQAALISMAGRDEVKLVVVDSLSGGTHKDTKKSNDVITVVKMLAEVARNTQKPVMLTHHLRKRGVLDVGDRITLDRVRDSSAIVQLARVIWALDTPDPEDTDNKRLSVIKNNLARFADPIGLKVGENGIIFGNAPEPPKQETLQDKAADLLFSLLAKKPVPAAKIEEEINQAGLSWHAAKRAKEKLGIVSIKPGGIWHWSLPAQGPNDEIPF